MKKTLVTIALLFLLAGCSQQSGTTGNSNTDTVTNTGIDSQTNIENNAEIGVGNLKVESGDTVKVEYVGSFLDGNVFDKSEGRGPLEFTVGARQMIEGFDEAVIGMGINEEKTVTISPEKAYGTAEEAKQTIRVPVAQISSENELKVGTKLYASGQEGTVVDVNAGIATIEFTHPLAGKTLRFWIKVVEIQKA
ncbi:MAG TPA: FKBP-type peptidyl-prolyl cis-trans isomerase [archaeon]|nr:FKBP-type peptidyl-prolyl cis-trans isomerase [archaeon]